MRQEQIMLGSIALMRSAGLQTPSADIILKMIQDEIGVKREGKSEGG